MKFTITRDNLQEGLVAVAAAVPGKTTLPVLSNILVEALKDGIRLSGTDLDIAVSTRIAASVDQEGAITLPAKKLVEIVRELPRRSHPDRRLRESSGSPSSVAEPSSSSSASPVRSSPPSRPSSLTRAGRSSPETCRN